MTRPGRFLETFQVFMYPKSFENELYPPPGFGKPGGSVSKFLPSAIPPSKNTFPVYCVPSREMVTSLLLASSPSP